VTTLQPSPGTRTEPVDRPFAVDVSAAGDNITVRVSGELDVATVHQLEPVLTAAALFHPVRLQVDLVDLTSMDSVGGELLISTAKLLKSRETELVVCSPNGAAMKVFEVLDLERYATIEL
jgi:anti-anti-sigma factor